MGRVLVEMVLQPPPEVLGSTDGVGDRAGRDDGDVHASHDTVGHVNRLTTLPRRAAARAADRVADALAPRLASRVEAVQHQISAADREATDNRNLELLLGFLLREDSNCVDVGANQGRFLSHMVARAPRGRHFAFEPLPQCAARLVEAFPGVEVHEAAVADAPGEAEFVSVVEDPAYSGLRERPYPGADWHTERIRVRVEKLDDQLPEDYVPTLIKIDVEGAELGVLRGALTTIRRHRPYVVFEHGVGAADRYATTPEAVHELLTGQAGLRVFDMDAAGPLSAAQFSGHYHAGTRWNFLAMP
jgi:FkbM family methyltransferase